MSKISGIYKLEFASGKLYIGQSVDVESRWKQHFEALRKGTAAGAVQNEFNNHGYPVKKVLFTCHPTYLNVMEAAYINANWDDNLLNTTKPTAIEEWETDTISRNEEVLNNSIGVIILTLENQTKEISEQADNIIALEYKLEEFKQKGFVLPYEHKSHVTALKSQAEQLQAENRLLKSKIAYLNKSWWEKLFS